MFASKSVEHLLLEHVLERECNDSIIEPSEAVSCEHAEYSDPNEIERRDSVRSIRFRVDVDVSLLTVSVLRLSYDVRTSTSSASSYQYWGKRK